MRGYPQHLHEIINVDLQENIYDEALGVVYNRRGEIRLGKCECKEMIRNLIDALEDCMYGYTNIEGQISKHLEYRDKYDDMIDEYEEWLNS